MITTSGLVLLGLLLSPPAAAAPRQASGACAGTSGVTVVVDFQDLDGGVNVVCATGTVSSGLDALAKAGVSYQTAQRFPGFVCRIAGRPANDPCVNTSPGSAYWSYWIAAPGGSWCYSTVGAGNRTPPAGTFEGWSFALNRTTSELPPPRFAPPPAPAGGPVPRLNATDCTSTPVTLPATTAPPTTASPTTPPPTTSPSTAPTAAPSTASATSLPTTAAASTTAATTHATTTTSTTTSTATSTAATDLDLVASATTVDLGEDGGGGGSPFGFVVSAAVVVALGAGALVIARTRASRGRTPT